jgi:hypothetical protein
MHESTGGTRRPTGDHMMTDTTAPVDQPKMGSITIQGLEFNVDYPYSAGEIDLTAGEASALNQTRAENLRNNFAARIKTMIEEYRETNKLPDDEEIASSVLDKDALDKEFADYADKYEFGVRQLGGGRVPMDPVEREAWKISELKVREALKASNVKLTSVSKEKMSELIEAVIAKYPDITEEAKRRVSAVGAIVIEDLNKAKAA